MLMMTPSAEMAHVVIVDDDPGLRELLTEFLGGHGLGVEAVASGNALRSRLDQRPCDLIVLDMMMPGEDGLSILRSLPQDGAQPGVIIFSAIGSEIDRVVALELGADDYVVKPSSPRELLARIRSVLRRRQNARTGALATGAEAGLVPGRHPRIAFAGWVLDPSMRTLSDPDGVLVSLSSGEFAMMIAFTDNPQVVLSREQLIGITHCTDSDSLGRSMDVKVSRLRRKLADANPAELIRTVRGRGYMFLPDIRIV